MSKQLDQTFHANSCDHNHHHDDHFALILFFIGLGIFLIGIFIPKGILQNIFYFLTFLLSGYHIIVEGFLDMYKKSIREKKLIPNVHILMTLAAIGAMFIGEFREAALLILIFAGAHFLEDYAEGKSQKEITSLLNLHP